MKRYKKYIEQNSILNSFIDYLNKEASKRIIDIVTYIIQNDCDSINLISSNFNITREITRQQIGKIQNYWNKFCIERKISHTIDPIGITFLDKVKELK